MVWFAVARWLELLPYWVGTIGVLFVLLGSGAYKPLFRLMGAGSKGKKKAARAAQPKRPARVKLGIREAGADDDMSPAAPIELPVEEPAPLPPPEPAVPETVDSEKAENFQELQARLAAARARRASGAVEPEPELTDSGVFDSGPDLQAQILQVARERDEEQREIRQLRKIGRVAQQEHTQWQEQQQAELDAAREQELAEAGEQPDAEAPIPQPEETTRGYSSGAALEELGTEGVGVGDLGDLALRIETLRDSLEQGDLAERERGESELRGLLVALRSTVGALELLSHAAPYLGPETPLDPEQELQLETALDRLRGD